MIKKLILIGILLPLIAGLWSCKKENNTKDEPTIKAKGITSLVVNDDFSWITSRNVKFEVITEDAAGNTIANAQINVYDNYPNGNKIISAETNQNGTFKNKYNLSSKYKSITIESQGVITKIDIPDSHVWYNEILTATLVIPENKKKSINAAGSIFYPSKTGFGTIAFEDSWPHTADYDMNDLVVDYNVEAVLDPADNNYISAINMKIILRAAGAGFSNGFGISFKYWWSSSEVYDIADVTGTHLTESIISNNANGTENGTTFPSIILFDNAKTLLVGSSNTDPTKSFLTPDTLEISINFNTPVINWNLEFPLQNPFIFVDQNRGREIHLGDNYPTLLADPSLFRTSADDTEQLVIDEMYTRSVNMGGGAMKAYKTAAPHNLPWGILISDSKFVYPTERSVILDGYTYFGNWAEAWGWNYTDWYEDNSGFRDNSYLYTVGSK